MDLVHGRILSLEDVSVSFDGFKALSGLSLDIARGELGCILGRNGVGKTTLLKSLIGRVPVQTGSIEFNGQAMQAATLK